MQEDNVIEKIGNTSFREVCKIYGVTLEEGFELFTIIVNVFMTEIAKIMDEEFGIETREEKLVM